MYTDHQSVHCLDLNKIWLSYMTFFFQKNPAFALTRSRRTWLGYAYTTVLKTTTALTLRNAASMDVDMSAVIQHICWSPSTPPRSNEHQEDEIKWSQHRVVGPILVKQPSMLVVTTTMWTNKYTKGQPCGLQTTRGTRYVMVRAEGK